MVFAITADRKGSRALGRPTVIAATLLILAVVLGGGGTPNPWSELWLEFLTVVAALAWVWTTGQRRPLAAVDPLLWIVAGITILLPLLQLVPLPPSLWTALPGRAPQLAALQLVGAGDSWQPLSMSPMRTFASLLSLGPPLALFAMMGALAPGERRWLVAAVVAMAAVSALFGALQLAGGQAALRLYTQSSELVITGFQANRNAEADLLLIGLLALAVLAATRPGRDDPRAAAPKPRAWWLAAGALLLGLATVFTASRTGIALLAVAVLAGWSILALKPATRWSARLPAIVGGALVLAVGAVLLLRDNPALLAVAKRFGLTHDLRFELWSSSRYVIGQYWPFGSGTGTFVPSFIAAEPLEMVDPSLPNRAHNDFLELALESGVFGFVALALIAAVLLAMAVRAWRRRPQDRAQIIFGSAALIIISAHSLVDYPLRSIALSCLTAVAAGMLAAPPNRSRAGSDFSPGAG